MKNTWAEMLRVAGREEEGQKVTDTKKVRGIRQETRLRSGYKKKKKKKNDRRKGKRVSEILRRQRVRALGPKHKLETQKTGKRRQKKPQS